MWVTRFTPVAILQALGIIIVAAAISGLLLQARFAPTPAKPSPIDIGFSQFMSLHHQQAITMSQLLLDGRPTGLAPLARTIATTQLLELGEMRGWLRLWEQDLYPSNDDMTWMLLGRSPLNDELRQYLIDCGRSPQGMPGMASPKQLQQLRQSSGRARDELFVQLMLDHHQGALLMARFTATEAALEPVRQLAGRILLEQAKEIYQLRSILTALARPQ